MTPKALALALLTGLVATSASARGDPGEGSWTLILITDGNKAGAGVSAVMDSKEACGAAARVLVNPEGHGIHPHRIAYCVSAFSGETAVIRQD